MENCIFCKIVSKELPSNIIYEDESTLAFLNLHPNNPGQVLLIPKEHYENYFETPDEILSDLTVKSKKIGMAIQTAMNADGMNIINNAKEAAGQVIFHTHIHLIPRHDGDGYRHWEPLANYDHGQDTKIAEKIKNNL